MVLFEPPGIVFSIERWLNYVRSYHGYKKIITVFVFSLLLALISASSTRCGMIICKEFVKSSDIAGSHRSSNIAELRKHLLACKIGAKYYTKAPLEKNSTRRTLSNREATLAKVIPW